MDLNLELDRHLLVVQKLQVLVKEYHTAINSVLHTGKPPRVFIKAKHIRETMKRMKKQHPDLNLIFKSSYEYVNIMETLVQIEGSKIIVISTIPFPAEQDRKHLYLVNKYSKYSAKHDAFYMLQNVKPYFFEDHGMFTEMDSSQFQAQCKNFRKVVLCSGNFVEFSSGGMSCVSDLFRSLIQEIAKTCTYYVIPSNEPQFSVLQATQNWHIASKKPFELDIECRRNHTKTKKKIDGNVFITLDEGCSGRYKSIVLLGNKKHHDDQNVNNITNLGNDLLHELHNLKMGMIMNMTGENTPNFDLLNKNIFEAKKQIEDLQNTTPWKMFNPMQWGFSELKTAFVIFIVLILIFVLFMILHNVNKCMK